MTMGKKNDYLSSLREETDETEFIAEIREFCDAVQTFVGEDEAECRFEPTGRTVDYGAEFRVSLIVHDLRYQQTLLRFYLAHDGRAIHLDFPGTAGAPIPSREKATLKKALKDYLATPSVRAALAALKDRLRFV